MNSSRLCLLLLLLSGCAAAQSHGGSREQTPMCMLESRYRVNWKYVYHYSTESHNSVVGTTGLRNGPKVSCQVQIEVPHTCSFIMHTRDCTLSEASAVDPQGQPVYRHALGSDTFRTRMERSPLKITMEGPGHVQLYPDSDEPVDILNIKRGIVSALMEGEASSTLHGQCLTQYEVNSRQDAPTGLTFSRDLSQCDHFYSRRLTNSPMALLQNLHHPISKLIKSTQSCSYQFDNKGSHITTATCTETHTYLPFFHRENGMSSVVTQELIFQSMKRISSKPFGVDPNQARPLHFEDLHHKSPVQTTDAVLSSMQELVDLAGKGQGQRRASLFQTLVSSMRGLRNETLSQAASDMVKISSWLTFQALFQCGTSECTSAIMQIIWTIDGVSLEVDALVYGLSLQPDPDRARVKDMLSMAQYKQSKAIMYALANTVKKFYKGEVTPEITEVSTFMEQLLNDCSKEIPDTASDFSPDPKEMSFLVLRVVGVMAQAMQDSSPSLVSSVLRCSQKTDLPLANQKAALRTLQQMDMNDEIRSTLMELYRDTQSPLEKRIAAYLVLMKKPDRSLLRDLVNSLMKERDKQLRSFVVSYLNNILRSEDPQMLQIKADIEKVLQGELPPQNNVFHGLSRNYKMESPLGSVHSNIIFDGRNTLPKEVILEATMKAFGSSYDIFEVGVEGAGFEPTVDALFGEKGFFSESISRLMRFLGDKTPLLKEVLDRISPHQERMKRQVTEDHLKAFKGIFQKLLQDVRLSEAPEATAYLRLLGEEIGYLKTSEMRNILEGFSLYYHIFIRVLPAQAFLKLTSSTENELFFHYIFMENAFSLPTASGFPLTFSLSGVLAPGVQGGLIPSAMTSLSVMPSVGLEFITHMGVDIPDYVDAGIQMHTNMYHESSLNAKISISRNQVRVWIPAPTSNTQVFSISNQLLSISSGQTKVVPSLLEDRVDSTDCHPFLRGLNICTIVRYSNGSSDNQAPYYPLNGDMRFAVEIQPTGKVSEYSATFTDETLREGKRGRHKVESLKLTLKAEGEEPMEATASLKYNHNKNLILTELRIPDYDVEAVTKLAVTDSESGENKLRGITIDITNKNIPQLTFVGRARFDTLKEALVQIHVDIPPLKSNGSVLAFLNKDESVLLDVETVALLAGTSYQQKTSLRYDEDKFEVELKTHLNSEIEKVVPNAKEHHKLLQQYVDDLLDQRVAKTDMKLRHIITKGIEAGNIWLDKLTARFPSLASLRSKRSISDLTLPALPEKLFWEVDSLFRYQFNKDTKFISFHLPFGGKKSEVLNLPKSVSVPAIDLKPIGLYIPAKTYFLPTFTIPPSLDFNAPLFGLGEVSIKIHSNLYDWDGSISMGNKTVDIPSYVVKYKSIAQSPLSLLSYKLEGIGMLLGRADENLKYLLSTSFSHILFDSSFSAVETFRVGNKFNADADYRIKASSPLGLNASLSYSAYSTSTLNSDEVSGDGTVEGHLKLGSLYTNTSFTHNYKIHPLAREGQGESMFRFNSPFIGFQNTIQGVYAKAELNLVSRTSAARDTFKHVAELKYKDAQLILKCNAVGTAMGKSLSNQVELGISRQMSMLRIESQGDDDSSRIYSLISGSLDSKGLEVISEGSLIFDAGRAFHKASVKIGRDGLTFGGTNSIQCSPVTVENVFDGVLDNSGASLSSTTKAMAEEGRGEVNIEGKITASEATIHGDLKGYAYDAATTNNIKIELRKGTLTFTGNAKGTLRQMRTEHSHTLALSLWKLSLRSKSDSTICDDIYYKEDTKVDIKPFVILIDMNNDLVFYDLSLYNEGHMKLEPLRLDLSGSVKGGYGEENNLKHIYAFTYDDLSGSVKYSTSGTMMNTQLSHFCETEFAGLASISNCQARLNSEPLHFDVSIRTMALPFSLTIDALANGEGEIHLHGKHNGRTSSKLLVKIAPLVLAMSHDFQGSTMHRLSRGESSSSLVSKLEGLLSPNDQSMDWKVISNLDNHVFEQSISAYNNPEKFGIEFSEVILTDIISKHKKSKREREKFSLAGFLKYDKNSDCHIIEIPFTQNFAVAFERLKNTILQGLESLQKMIRDLDVNKLITDYRASLDQLPKKVKSFLQAMDLENKVNKVKEKLDYWIKDFSITMADMELWMNNLKQNTENTIIDIATKVQNLISTIEEYAKSEELTEKLSNVLSYTKDQLEAFDDRYKIKESLVKVLAFMEDIIQQIDLQKLKLSSAAFLQELDSKYGLVEAIRGKLSQMKQDIEDFNLSLFLVNLKNDLLSLDWPSYIGQLSYQIPSSEIMKFMESMNEVIVNWIDEYEVPNKLNAIYSYFRNIFVKYNLDMISKDLMDQTVNLVEQFKLEETVQSIVEAIKSIRIEFIYDKLMDLLYTVTKQLREFNIKKSIHDLNEHISSIIKSMKEFEYSEFVDAANRKITEATKYLNEEIQKYEIVKKIEALREFFREIQNSVFSYLEEVKNTKVADALNKLKDVIDTAFYNDVKLKLQDMLEDARQRIVDMDIREEMYKYLQRASESYSNIVGYISVQFNQLFENILKMTSDNEIINQTKQAANNLLEQLRRAEIDIPTFKIPLTDLVIPALTIKLGKLQEISIPAQISIPKFTILSLYAVPAFTIDFDEIKIKIITIIDHFREFEIKMPNPEQVFGDLKVLYLFKLPDLTLSEITLSEIKIPSISIPKLKQQDFEITMLPVPDIKLPDTSKDICIPFFGKLYGEFSINSPHYTLITTGKVENATSSLKNPQFVASFTSQAKSSVEALEYTLEATTRLEAPRMKKLQFTETVKATHKTFSVDHKGYLTLTSSSAESGINAVINTTYNHYLDIPSIKISNQASMKQNIKATMESGTITVVGQTSGDGKGSIQGYSDEGTHNSHVEFSVDLSTAKFLFAGETHCQTITTKHSVYAESVLFSHIIVEAKGETKCPVIKNSVFALNGEAHIGNLTASLTASHDTEFIGNLIGTMSNGVDFVIHPFEIVLDVKNKLNLKMFFPLKLSGKVDLHHHCGTVVASEKQGVYSIISARFNQYKYSHKFTAENTKLVVYIQSSVNGEANLDFMTLPFSIPRMSVPYFETKTPEITNFSLWEDTVLKSLLITPHQTFDINLKVQYNKNLETHSFELHLEPIYSAISDNAKIIQTQFEVCRDKVVTLLKDSYNEAKSQYIKHKIDTSGLPPRIFRVPGYTIPILNIQVSAFRAEMPAFSYFVPKEVSTPSFKIPALGFSVPSYTLVLPTLKFPVVHVPETLGEIKLPSLTLPSIQDNIAIPSFGNITLDFSLKSNMVTLSANAAISKQSDVVVQFEASSKSVFDILNGKIDATTSLTRKRGLKVASTVSLEHNNFEANHECALSLTKKSLEASVANSAKISFPFLQLEFNQELLGNTKTKPNVSSKKKLRYMFYIPLVESTGKGDFDMKWELDVLPSHMSFETSTQGKSDIAIMDMYNFDKDFENRASFYININGFSSTAATTLNVNINRKEKLKRSLSRNIFSLELDNNLVVGVSFIHVFAAAYYKSNNNVDLLFFSTNGNHTGKGELDIVPLATLKITINTDGDQFSNFGDIGFIHSMNLSCSPEKQTFTWSGKQQLTSLVHACDLSISNDESEQRLDLTGMVEGPLAFLKSVRLPVYQRTLWDVLKFDQVTNINTRQFLNYSSSIVYTKNEYGYEIPFKVFENGVTFSIPEISITLPSWMRNIPRSIKNEDMGSENLVVPDRFTLPPAVSLPAFDVPFTNLHVEQLTVDPKNFDVPKVISTKAFDIFLPGLPVISVPSYDINTEYVQRTTSFLSFKIPQYEITVSPGELTAGMNKITSHILDLEVPPIMIPEQKIKIPEVVLHLPTTVLVPVFGALSATLKVSSPIYNVSTTASVEMKDPNLVASLNSTCTSTMAFLEYGLTGTANLKYDNGQMFLSGICNLIHNDVNVNWQHVLAHKLRAKRQISRGDAVAQDSRHTLSVDVTSRTFADVSFRFASRKDGLTASASSPSAGFLGLNLQRRSPSQLHGKLFSRYLSSSDKDTNVFSAKVLLRNSDKLVLQTAWNLDFFNDATEGFKRKIPAMTDAVLKFINKYHTAHFGFDLNRGGMKLKNAISSLMETAFRKVLEFLTELQGLVEEVSEKGESLFRAASDSLMSIDVQEIRAKLIMMADEAMKNMQRRTKALLDAVRLFLSQQKFSLPGSETEMSVTEMFQRTHLYVSRAVDSGIQWLTSLMEKTSAYIKNTNVSLPATEVVVNGEEVMDKLTSIAVSAYNQIKDFSSKIMLFLSKTLNGVLQLLAKNTDQLLVYLKDEKSKISSQADVIHAEVLQTSRRHIQGAKRRTTEFKDLVKLRINQAYNSVNLENINSGAEMFVGSLQSNLSDAFGESVDVMKRFSQNTAPYFKVGNQRADVEIPLPFLWKSFHEWPVPMRL
uniref:Apolipoprotein Ba n=1 Tax=Oryzias latipes TaxID=8090 RepID=A0A3B3IC86_ORYLA